jgi:hypothetical protein
MVSDWQGYLCGDMKIYIVALVILVVDVTLLLLLVPGL